jgi:hypothetical protein
LPEGWLPWRKLVRRPDKDDLLKKYFSQLLASSSPGTVMAKSYLQRFKEIGSDLVKNKVAFKFDDVNALLIHGFHHAYGPVNDYF